MGADSPSYRSSADWMFTDWLQSLGYPYSGIWHYVLGHVRAWGNGRGKCKAVTAERFAGMYGLPVEHVSVLLEAAEEAGAMMIEKDWALTAWAEYQSPGAERMRRARAQVPNVRHNHDLCVTTATCDKFVRSDGTNPSPLDGPPSPQHSPTPPIIPPSVSMARPKKEEAEAYGAELGLPRSEVSKYLDHFASNGWKVGGKAPMKDWKAAMRGWKARWAEKLPVNAPKTPEKKAVSW